MTVPMSVPKTLNATITRAENVIPGGVNSATRRIGHPGMFTHADGAHVTDSDGRRYLDYHAAFGAVLLGHNHPRVNDAVRHALGGADLIGLGVTESEVELAELVVESIPSVEMTILTMSGTEATAQAVRLARAVTGRTMIVKFQGGFHGWHDAVARNVISSPELAYGFDPSSAGILPSALEATLIAEFNDINSVQALFDRYSHDIAAVIVEPIPHNVGALIPTWEFVTALRALTERHDSLLIFDEVITGFRHGLGGYQERCGITPDLTTFGKAMGNGIPVAGMGGQRHLMEHFSSAGGDVLLAGTFNGNPISCAAAIATITQLRDDTDFYPRTFALGDRMRRGLQSIITELDITACVAGYGGVFAVYFAEGPIRGYRDLLRNNDSASVSFHRRMTDQGFLMLPMALKRNHISGAHTAHDVDLTLEAARSVLQQMVDEGECS